MRSYNTNELYSGIKIIQGNEPYMVIDNEFVKPGKGQAFNRVRLRNLISGKILDKIFKSGEIIEAANIIDVSLTYLYYHNNLWYFMNNQNYEQLFADTKVIGNNAKWLIEQTECVVTIWNKRPIIVTPPNFVTLRVTHTNPSVKGDTANTSNKLAVLATGAIVKVPLFIQVNNLIKIDTRSGEYVSRIK